MTDQEYEELVEKGFELWSHITEVMNNIIIEDGTIDINDKRIWNANLHKWNNEHWYCALAAVEYVYEQKPEVFSLRDRHHDALEQTKEFLFKYRDLYDNVLNQRNKHINGKKVAWRMAHTMREVMCNIKGIDLPNNLRTKDTAKSKYNRSMGSQFNALFIVSR